MVNLKTIHAFATVAALLGAPSLALAQEDDPETEARDLFQSGRAAFEASDYEAALADWTKAYGWSGRPQLHYNIGRAHEELGHDAKAISAFEVYLKWENDGEKADEARGRILRLRKTAAPAPKPVDLQKTEEPAVEAMNLRKPAPEFTKFQEPLQEPPPARPVRSHALPVSLLVGGGALLVAGTVTGIMAMRADGELDDLCGTIRRCAPERLREGRKLGDKVDALGIATDVMLPLGAILAGIGAWLLWTTAEDVDIACGSRGCEGRFEWEI